MLLDEKTIHRYQHAYPQNPTSSFWETDYHGSDCSLSEKQLQQLDPHLQQTVYLTVAACGWIKKGPMVTLPSNTGRRRLNINGTLNPDTLDVVTEISATINGDSTIALLKKLEKKHPDAKAIYVIPDNARYYRSQAVQDYLKDSRIRLEFLPPYSPNLNLIERLWRYFRKKVLPNKCYETFDEFKEACLLFFKKIQSYRPELRTLLTENFHIMGT